MKTSRWKSKLVNLLFAILPAALLSLASLLFEYVYMGGCIYSSPGQLMRPLVILWSAILLLMWPIHRITGHYWQWTGLVLFIFVLIFFLSEVFFYVISASLLTTLVVWTLVTLLLKRKLKIEVVTFVSTAIAGALILLLTVQLSRPFLSVRWQSYWDELSAVKSITSQFPNTWPENSPDIYYIVLDGYGRSDILQEYYHYDNSTFINYLTAKGFIVPSGIYSNYARTALSVSATLNFDYIENLTPGIENSLFWWLMIPLVRESRVQGYLEEVGYQSISIGTAWDITDNTNADIYFEPYQIHLSEFETFFLGRTPLRFFHPLLSNIAYVRSFESHRELILYDFETLSMISKMPGRKFVFAHIIAPHPPFVFNQYGNHVEPGYGFQISDASDFPGTIEEYRTGYIGQVEYVNSELQKTIDLILSQSETPPIIILQADHGPGMLVDFDSLENTCVKERFSIFAAYYLPGLESNIIPNDVTPVNVFRIIFNEYFSTSLPLLENSSYYSRGIYIYQTEDITSLLENADSDHACIQEP